MLSSIFVKSFSIFLCIILALASSSNDINDPSIDLGKIIYEQGKSESDHKIIAVVNGTEMSATFMPCANCHGKCGIGNSLQGIDIPDISAAAYLKQNLKEEPNTRKHINSKLKKAITLGINHQGKTLHNMMPRYKLSLDDMNNLLAYLAVLGTEETCNQEK